jgi:hypothetical protein
MDAAGWAAHQPEASKRDVDISVFLKRIGWAFVVAEFFAGQPSIPYGVIPSV